MLNIGINGFGRIGRNFLRAAWGRSDIRVVAVNDLTDSRTLAHLLKRDSLLGTFGPAVEYGEGELRVDSRRIRVFAERDPGNIPWAEVGADVVIESTGRFTARADADRHLGAKGAKKVIVV